MQTLNAMKVRLIEQASALLSDESGASAVEYGLLATLIAVAIIGTVRALGAQMQATFTQVTSGMKG